MSEPGPQYPSRLQAVVVGGAFALQLAGSNALNPLLPLYRERLGLSSLAISLTFVLYVSTLVVALITLTRPRWSRAAPVLVVASLVFVIIGDLAIASDTEPGILVGRAITGLAGGLSTGASAALVVAAVGASGRAISATGNLTGGFVGALLAQVAVLALPAALAPSVVLLTHAALSAALLVAATVLLIRRRTINASLLRTRSAAVAAARPSARTVRITASGCVAWIGVSVSVVFAATTFAELHHPAVQAVGPVLLLAASAGAQLLGTRFARLVPRATGHLVLALGAAGVLVGLGTGTQTAAIIGFGLLGIGCGTVYRTGLVALTRSSVPATHGALSSAYAAVTYTVAATTVLLLGWLASHAGDAAVLRWCMTLLGATALTATVWAPRLRDAI